MPERKQLRLTPKEQFILELLTVGGEMYGLEMVHRSGGELARGSVYVLLDRLEEKGMVESWQEDKAAGASGIPRRLYKVNGEGSRALRAAERKRAAVFGQLARA